MNRTELQRKVETTANLPSLPTVVTKIIETVDDPNSSTQRLNELIVQEPALAARMLRLANSAFFGRRSGMVSLPQCALVLGLNTVRSLALSASVHQMMSQAGVESFDPRQFWRHSLGTGVAGRVMARHCGQDAEAAMSAGLVHDIGRLVLDVVVRAEYGAVLARIREGADEAQSELKAFGATHAEVGGWLALKWKLPPSIIAAISCHDRPESAPEEFRPLARLVRLADSMAEVLGRGKPASLVDRSLWDAAGIRIDAIPEIEASVGREWKLAEDVMGGDEPVEHAA